MLAYIHPIEGGFPDQGLPETPPPVDPGYGIPGGRPGIWPKPPVYPPNIVAPPIYIPGTGWINVPTFPALPIVIPPVIPPGMVKPPNFPSNPIVIPPLPVVEVPEGSVLILVVTAESAAWRMVEKSATKPIPMPEPK